MRKPKANTASVVQKWADELREAAAELEDQAKLLYRAADALQSKPVPVKGVFVGPPSTRDRDGDAVIHP